MTTSETFDPQCRVHIKEPIKINRSRLEYLIGFLVSPHTIKPHRCFCEV
jgi:hypothetical protein